MGQLTKVSGVRGLLRLVYTEAFSSLRLLPCGFKSIEMAFVNERPGPCSWTSSFYVKVV